MGDEAVIAALVDRFLAAYNAIDWATLSALAPTLAPTAVEPRISSDDDDVASGWLRSPNDLTSWNWKFTLGGCGTITSRPSRTTRR